MVAFVNLYIKENGGGVVCKIIFLVVNSYSLLQTLFARTVSFSNIFVADRQTDEKTTV